MLPLLLVFSCKEDDVKKNDSINLQQGLVAHYTFDGDANDQTTNGFHGIVHGAVLTTDKDGNANSAYSFDGIDDYILVPHNSKLSPENFSISLWAEISSEQEAHDGINDIFRKWDGDAQGYPYGISYLNSLADDALEDRLIYARYDGQACNNSTTTYSAPITNDTFVHIVLIKDGNKLRTFVDAVGAEEVEDVTTCTTGNDADITIGARGNLMRFFKGKIDNIRFYNRALTLNEVGVLYAE